MLIIVQALKIRKKVGPKWTKKNLFYYSVNWRVPLNTERRSNWLDKIKNSFSIVYKN